MVSIDSVAGSVCRGRSRAVEVERELVPAWVDEELKMDVVDVENTEDRLEVDVTKLDVVTAELDDCDDNEVPVTLCDDVERREAVVVVVLTLEVVLSRETLVVVFA